MARSAGQSERPLEEARQALRAQRFAQARRILDEALRSKPDDVDALCLSALTEWRAHGDFELAAQRLMRARAMAPADVRVLTLSAEFALHYGASEEVFAHARAALAIAPDKSEAYVAMARSNAAGLDAADLRRMKTLAESGDLSGARLRFLANAIGRTFDARAQYDEAFAWFETSNRLVADRYDPAAQERRLSAAQAMFTPAFFSARKHLCLSGAGCVFMFGPPRTGSTLIEQMLVAHPGAESCGESDALRDVDAALRARLATGENARAFDHVAALDAPMTQEAAKTYLAQTDAQRPARADGQSWRLRLDKKLGNFLHAGLMRVLFPDAVALWVRRHPLDVCLSCFTQGFEGHAYAARLHTMAHFYRIQHAHMRLWSELFPSQERHLSYERFIAAPAVEAQRLFADLGLSWRDDYLATHARARFVETASAAQIREPVHAGSIGRWRNYEKHLKPLIDAFGGMQAVEAMAADMTD